MKIFKTILDWITRIGLSAIVVLFLIVAPFSILPSLLKNEAEINKIEKFDYQGILEVWHVETFEGGSVSRSTFLEREATIFEKKHKGTYIVIQTMSLEQFELNIASNKRPNMLSFGIGVGNSFVNDLIELNSSNIRDDLLLYGKYEKKQLAIPYILGGYALISQNNDGVVGVGLKSVTNPLMALDTNNKKIAKLYDDKNLDSYDCYDKFLKGNFGTLCGTQRDVYRIFNRQNNGKMEECDFEFLAGYSDLIQYLSIFKSAAIEENLCTEFAKQLTSSETQNKLKDYSLFSTLKSAKLYQNGLYDEFEKVLGQNLKSENCFSSKELLEKNRTNAFDSVVIK